MPNPQPSPLTPEREAEIRRVAKATGREVGSLYAVDELLAALDFERQRHEETKREIDTGTAELRRYVEGNGFEWQDQESTVFNVTTAIGLLGGTVEALKADLADARADNAEIQRAVDRLLRLNCLMAYLSDFLAINVPL